MITFELTEVVGWEHAIRGMRNPMNSWEKTDTYYDIEEDPSPVNPNDWLVIRIGPNDHSLMKRLRDAGADHRKFMRMIAVYVDITAPLYWWAEMDTYKVGTVRNSCSFMHKGVSRQFTINDFSLKDERIYEVLNPLTKKTYTLKYPYETDDYRIYEDENGRTYRVYKNGRIIRESFDYVDNWGTGRKRHFEESEPSISQINEGYFYVTMSGRGSKKRLLHNIVAEVWIDKPEGATQVDHIDGDKGNNSVENLEWVTPSENVKRAIDKGLYENSKSLHRLYLSWKSSSRVIPPSKRISFKRDCESGMSYTELAEKYNITPTQANNVRSVMRKSENEDLFHECYVWEQLIDCLNSLRELYLVTKDNQVFQQIRCMLPSGYLQTSTVMLNYEVLANIYHSRKNHKLDEWRVGFMDWIKSLPYSELITGEETDNDRE